MVSPVRPSRESITLSSTWAQKGHFTRLNLLATPSLVVPLSHLLRSGFCAWLHLFAPVDLVALGSRLRPIPRLWPLPARPLFLPVRPYAAIRPATCLHESAAAHPRGCTRRR